MLTIQCKFFTINIYSHISHVPRFLLKYETKLNGEKSSRDLEKDGQARVASVSIQIMTNDVIARCNLSSTLTTKR